MKRERDFVRIVSDAEGNQRRIRDMAELHKGGEPTELLERRRDAVETMRRARAELERELVNVTAILAFRGDTWSILHTLWHLGARGSHMEPARMIVERGASEVPSVPKRQQRLDQAVRMTLAEIDDSITFAESLTAPQLALHAKRVNRDVYVIGIVEGTAEHFTDHLSQIREAKRALGLEVFG